MGKNFWGVMGSLVAIIVALRLLNRADVFITAIGALVLSPLGWLVGILLEAIFIELKKLF
ncbi:hypothetical protein LQF76_08000 [Gloeomargaritales cyanobacterium VI4D9]|nr:hypothetical protein LQF76_08000 [Gloeomargaritales cyanobacterium VI4D9]